MRVLTAFVLLSRPMFLYGGIAGVGLGAAVAAWSGHPIGLATYLWVQAMVTAFHLMVHYANDYFDRESDAAGRRTAWSGGSGIVVVGGALAPQVALVAALLCAGLGLVCAARFALVGNPLVALLGFAILVGSWVYSAPPLRLAARGLGELDAALVVAGLVPAAADAAFAGRLDPAIAFALPGPILAMVAMMLCVEVPDCGDDALSGKRTWVVRLGPATTYARLPIVVGLGALATALALDHTGGPLAIRLLGLPAFTCAAGLVWIAWRGDWRPGWVAFGGVAFYATTATGLALAYGATAAAH
jgi:1,4-dihydroxy-2-naphthoate octaprenyltransferase